MIGKYRTERMIHMNYKEFYTRCNDLYAVAPDVDSFDIINEVYTNLEWMSRDKAASMWKSFGIEPFKAMMPTARQAAEAYKAWQSKQVLADKAKAEADEAFDAWKKFQ